MSSVLTKTTESLAEETTTKSKPSTLEEQISAYKELESTCGIENIKAFLDSLKKITLQCYLRKIKQ